MVKESFNVQPKNLPQRLECIPVLHVRGTHYSVGYSIGRMFKSMIQEMIGSWKYFNEVLLTTFNSEEGAALFKECLQVCELRYPQLVDEIRGMAEGSELSFEKLFLLNIDSIMESIHTHTDSVNDLFAINGETGCTTVVCNKNEVILGHTEDAMTEILNNVYIVEADITDDDGNTIEKFTSFSYAGHLMGYTMGFNSHGMVHSVNTLFPTIHKSGTPRAFIARAILGAKNLEELLDILRDTGSGIADGFSLNVHFARDNGPKLFYNIEVAPPSKESKFESVLDVLTIPSGDSYVHCNKYLRIGADQKALPTAVSTCRHQSVDQIGAPQGEKDVKVILSNQEDEDYPIYICDAICTKLSHVKTVAVGIFNLTDKTWSVYTGKPADSSPVTVIPMRY